MSTYRIVTDATADLPQDLVENMGLSVIPMECRLNDETFIYEPTGKFLKPEAFYAQMREGAATSTSQINVFAFVSHFEPILQAGEDILYIAFSSALTGSQQSAVIAIQELEAKYPDVVFLWWTLCARPLARADGYAAAKKKKKAWISTPSRSGSWIIA